MGMNSEGDVELDKESNTVDVAYEKVQEEGLEQSEKMADTIQAALDMSNVDSSQVEITTTSQYVMLSLSSGILFDSGKADLKAEAISVVDKVADAVKIYDEILLTLNPFVSTKYVYTEYALYIDSTILSGYCAVFCGTLSVCPSIEMVLSTVFHQQDVVRLFRLLQMRQQKEGHRTDALRLRYIICSIVSSSIIYK